jgi:hypothetical protein
MDPVTDPYSAAREEGCALTSMPDPRARLPLPARFIDLSTAAEGDVMMASPVRLAPGVPGRAAGIPMVGKSTDVLTRPVAGQFRSISLFPRPVEVRLRCRPPRSTHRLAPRGLPVGERTSIHLPESGSEVRAGWIGCDPIEIRSQAPAYPHVAPACASFRQPLGAGFPIGLHPKTRNGASVCHDAASLRGIDAAVPARRARLTAAVQSDWLTVMAGAVPVVPPKLNTGRRSPAGGVERIDCPVPAPAIAAVRLGSIRLASHGELRTSVRIIPIPFDTSAFRDTKKSPRGEFVPATPALTALQRPSGLSARCHLLRVGDDDLDHSAWALAFRKLTRRIRGKALVIGGGVMALAGALALGPGLFNGREAVPVASNEVNQTSPASVPVAKTSAPAKPVTNEGTAAVLPVAAAPAPPPSMWANLQKRIVERAAIAFTDDFRNGLSDWTGSGNWARHWSYDAAGFVRTGPLGLYSPTLELTDYRMEFLGQIERRSLGWVVRASDPRNYYACKLTIANGGPVPDVVFERYRVVNGRVGAVRRRDLPMQVQTDTVYQVQTEMRGDDFAVTIQGIVVDSWSDDRLRRGGVGFFSGGGELARIRWVGVWHQYDMLGRLCAFLAPAGFPGR